MWITVNRKLDELQMFHFSKYQVCFSCYLPQGDYFHPAYPALHKGGTGYKKGCPMQDFVILFLIFIHINSDWWQCARLVFRTLPA